MSMARPAPRVDERENLTSIASLPSFLPSFPNRGGETPLRGTDTLGVALEESLDIPRVRAGGKLSRGFRAPRKQAGESRARLRVIT